MSAEHTEQAPADEVAAKLEPPVMRAWLMHRDRATFRDIADKLGIGVATAKRWVDKADQAIDFAFGGEAAERKRDLAAIDRWISRLDAGVESGEIALDSGARCVLPFFTRRAAMLGYDAARKASVYIEPERPESKPDMATIREFQRVIDEYEQQEGSPPEGFQ